ncbi:MAG TPA: NPCBM/NEW2 domain-containing protein [Chitinophagaceae bacterium]|nr:NPCBM/NEW2 domain-containing protein [Chitinophagaceae bacterium]
MIKTQWCLLCGVLLLCSMRPTTFNNDTNNKHDVREQADRRGTNFSDNKTGIQITPAQDVRVQGDLLSRMQRAIRYLDKASPKEIWDGFNDGMWGADWSGRTLEAYSRVALSTGNCSSRYDEIGSGLLSRQSPDGAFHIGKAKFDFEKTAGFWFGNARGMMGLLWAYRYKKDPRYLAAARKLGDYYVQHYFDKDQPSAPGSFWWVATESMYALYDATHDRKYLDNATQIARTIPPVLMSSQHTHSYLLSIRGIAQIAEETRDSALLNKVFREYAIFRSSVMWPGGGIVEHLGDRKTQNLDYWYDEGCSVDDWLGLNLDCWRLTLDPSYMDMVERVALNHLLYDQDEGGGFCGDRSVDFVREGAPWPFCCSMHGTRTLSELTQYIAMTDGKDVFINLFYPSTTHLSIRGTGVEAGIQTDYPANGKMKISVTPAAAMSFSVKVRIPAWSRVVSARVNGKEWTGAAATGYLSIARKWQAGDYIELILDMPLRTEQRNRYIGDDEKTDLSLVSLWKGPRQLVCNQQLNMHLWKAARARPALSYSYQTYDTLQFDRSVKGTPLKIGLNTYAKGLGTHSISEIEYSLGGQFKEFRADIGVDEQAGDEGAVRFKVCVDGLVKAGTLVTANTSAGGAADVKSIYGFNVSAATGKDDSRSIRVGITGAQVLRLVVDDAVNGFANDYADWANARLIREDGTAVYLSDLPDDRRYGSILDRGKIRLEEMPDRGQATGIVSLAYAVPGQPLQPIRLNYLADLGYSLIAGRPVLKSWIKLDGKSK